MTEASIPVDLFNPGQVFACLGFLEAAEMLLGNAEGGFDWSIHKDIFFRLCAKGAKNPFSVVLQFLTTADIIPHSFTQCTLNSMFDSNGAPISDIQIDCSGTFPCPDVDTMTLPIHLVGLLNDEKYLINFSHWADGSSRNTFKLYSGNRSAADISRAMLLGTQKKSKKKQGEMETYGLRSLWKEHRSELEKNPFNVLTPLGGSFNFDPRGAWTGIDAGYSPNDQKHAMAASPVVEILAALGLEHARPDEFKTRQVRYAAWNSIIPPFLARAALSGALLNIPLRKFQFTLFLSGKNKVITFAKEEIQ